MRLQNCRAGASPALPLPLGFEAQFIRPCGLIYRSRLLRLGMRVLSVLFLILPVFLPNLQAQHDGARNAVQLIAKGQFAKVESTLAKKETVCRRS